MLTHGISQGSISAASGGKFQHGFFSAALTSGVAPDIMKKFNSNGAKILASSVVGGTASVLGGGKFANGAITGAFVMIFNHMSHSERKDGEIEARKSKVDFQKATDQEKVNQLLYAFDYENMKYEVTGEYSPIDLDNYFSNLPINGTSSEGSHYFEGYTNIGGESTFVGVDFVAYKRIRYPFATQYSDQAQYGDKWFVMKFFRYPQSGTHGHLQLSIRAQMNQSDNLIKRYKLQ